MTRHGTDTQFGARDQYSGQETPTYYAQHDFEGPSKLSTTVVHAVAEVANVDITDTESTLFQHVDPDALDQLFRPAGQGVERTDGHVHLDIWGYDVAVYGDGQIVIASPPRPRQ